MIGATAMRVAAGAGLNQSPWVSQVIAARRQTHAAMTPVVAQRRISRLLPFAHPPGGAVSSGEREGGRGSNTVPARRTLIAEIKRMNRASAGSPDQPERSTPCRSPKNRGGLQGSTNAWIRRPLSRAQRASERTLSLATAALDQQTSTTLASSSARSMVASQGASGGMSKSHQTSSPALRSASIRRVAGFRSSRL